MAESPQENSVFLVFRVTWSTQSIRHITEETDLPVGMDGQVDKEDDVAQVGSPVDAKKSSMLKEGDRAPDFTLPDEQGTPVSLVDFRGKAVVLWFYVRDFTPG